MKQRI